MLYRNHFLFSSLSPFTASLPLSSSSSSFRVVEQEMEPMQNVLNGDIRTDMADFKPTLYYNHASTAASSAAPLQSALSDDMSAVNGQNGQTGDDFSVDDLLDFSNVVMDDAEEEQKQEFFDTAVAADVNTTFSNVICTTNMAFCSPLPPTELTVPADDLENLEWLSHFVEDSFSEYSMACPVMKPPPELQKSQSGEGTMTIVEKKPALPTPVQTKARTKRARTGLRVWSLGSPPLTESSTGSSSSSSSSSMSSSCQPSFCLTQVVESLLGKPPVKKPKKKPTTMVTVGGGGCVGGGQQPRRCSHCGVQKTPQWRAGPLGVKTLCNACGVRFKSGRLLPEYRPACSPTFSSELHSNNHRKVLEMRQKKDLPAGFSPPVQSF